MVVEVSFIVEISVVEVLMCVVVVLINDSLLMDVVLMEDTVLTSSLLMDVMLMKVILLNVLLADGGSAPLDLPPRSNTNAPFLASTIAADIEETKMTNATMTADECTNDFSSFISLDVVCRDVR